MYLHITGMTTRKISPYLYNETEDRWHLSPAYDLTYSNTYYGEHTTTVDGNGRNPGRKELLAVGMTASMKRAACEQIIVKYRHA